jgi:hypothetical protein
MTEKLIEAGKLWIAKVSLSLLFKTLGVVVLIIALIVFVFMYIITSAVSSVVISQSKPASSASQNSNSSPLLLPEIVKNSNTTITFNNKVYYLPVIRPDNKNLFYALLGIRFAESFRPENTYQPNDRDSCGQYQQRVSELYNGGLKTNIAKQILGSKFDTIFTSQRITDVNRWNYKTANIIQDGEIKFIPIAGGYVAYYPVEMTLICKDLVENHLETGLFDLIAIERLKERNIYDYLINYDLRPDNAIDFTYALCRSQAPASCNHWVMNSLPSLRLAISDNLFDSLQKK